jgi:tetrahydromethanopterin S-methyltransferase subunit B
MSENNDPRFPQSWQDTQQQDGQPQQQYTSYSGKPQKPKGQTMVLVAGILMTISGGFGILISGLGFLAALVIDLEHTVVFGAEIPDTALLAFGLLLAAATLAFGITGIVMRKKPGAAQTIVTLGVILIAVRVIDIVIGFGTEMPDAEELGMYGVAEAGYMAGYYFGFFFGIIIGLIPPVLYVAGGNNLKKSG